MYFYILIKNLVKFVLIYILYLIWFNILLAVGHQSSFVEQEELLAGLEHGLETLLRIF